MQSEKKNYQAIAAEKKAQQRDKIPKNWRIPTERFHDATNVMDVPLTCGLLNETEFRITSDYDATALLEKLKAGVWSVEQVTVAFCKRAAIAQQLVGLSSTCRRELANLKPVADELSDGDILRRCY
jgi:amidase